MSGEQQRDPRLLPALRTWFGPPRPHGEVERDRTVSFLELFYDLVFVVLIGQLAHHLAEHVSWDGVVGFSVVFGLIWIAWLNGSSYHEFHGREDGRSRLYIFGQMGLLVLLAVFVAHATEDQGRPFAVVYVLLLGLLAWQWYAVSRVDDPAYLPAVWRYIGSLVFAMAVVGISAFAAPELRLWLWGLLVVGWLVFYVVQFARLDTNVLALSVTESMAERFGLFIILVLGEVVVGVVDGLIEAGADALSITTGMFALTIGFGFWWNYFDAVGRIMPRQVSATISFWILLHFPLAGSIAATGAGMVSLIEHAGDVHTPTTTAWLLSGASAMMLVCLAALMNTMDYDAERAAIRPPLLTAQLVGAAVCLLIGFIAPTPWLLALLLTATHSLVWGYGFLLWARRPQLDVAP